MLAFFETLVKICFFRAKPQDLPSGRKWLMISAALIICATVIAGFGKETGNQIVLFALMQVSIYAAVIWLILKIKGVQERWPQTITALFGTSFLLQLAAVPFSANINLLENGEITLTNDLLFIFAISLWNLLIIAHILKNSIEKSFLSALVLGFFAQAISLTIALSLIGPPAVDAAL